MNNENPEISTEHTFESDINLVDIWLMLVRRKKIIFLAILSIVLTACIYMVLAKPIYLAEAFLSPPSVNGITQLNIINDEINKDRTSTAGYVDNKKEDLTVDDIYSQYLTALKSKDLLNSYFSNIFESQEELESNVGDLAVELTTDPDKQFYKVTLEGANSKDVELWLNDILKIANKWVVDRNVHDINIAIDVKTKFLKNEIENKRKFAKQYRDDQVSRLEEQYQIAKKLGIINNKLTAAPAASGGDKKSVVQEPLEYLKGTKSLRAEIDALKNRKVNDPFIIGLRDLQERVNNLELINFDYSSVEAVTIDQPATASDSPAEPKYILILVLAIIFGCMLGVLAVFTAEFMQLASEHSRNNVNTKRV